MIYSFITNKDIDVCLKQYFLDQMITGVPHVLKTAEGAAFSLMKSMLNSRYDLTKLFPTIKEWTIGKAYLTGEYCAKGDVIYKAVSANTGNDPAAANSTFWTEEDPRDKLLIIHCVNITIFYISRRISPRKISQDVIDDYNMAVGWLEDVKRCQENPDFPLIDVVTGGMEVKSGSNKKLDHYW